MSPYQENNTPSTPIVYVIGAGIRGRKHLTLEAISFLKQASLVLFFPCETISKDWLENNLGVACAESLHALYQDGARDEDNYTRIVNRILESANEVSTVAVLMPGHPRVGVTWIADLEIAKYNGNIQLRVVDGISSVDTMISDLKRDPLEHGALIVDANRILLYNLNLDPRLDHYI
ncbi:SAM-dependent methyltransferase [Alicyclobacillus suci]|uniref:SAM-dependent methyltransferase n=1 Tax=Alicyclobacillus suci TaxID=2816080 RepID=UPI001A8D72FC|nr:SAM-dependent methyltransferase [Alicyclobacillus suci]